MARDPEKPAIRLVEEEPPKPQEVVRLTSREGTVTRSAPKPMAAPLERLEPAERIREELRTHEPDYEALAEAEVESRPLEDTWADKPRNSKPVPWGWFVLISLICAGGAIWSVVHLLQNTSTPVAARVQALQSFDKEEKEKSDAEEMVNRILTSVRTYCQADTLDELSAVIRQPQRVRPLMEDWYKSRPLKSERFDKLDLFQPVTLENKGSFWMVSCTMKDGEKRHLLLEEQEDGKVKVDWETEVCYQPMDWDQYANERPVGSLDFRLRVSPDNLYSHEFTDSDKWACYRLSTLRGEQPLFGYVQRNSETGRKLNELFAQNGNREAAVLLRISTPTGLKSPRGVVIEKLCSPRWTYVEPPDT